MVAALVIASGLVLVGCSAPSGQREGYTTEGIAQGPPEGPVPDVVGESFQQACRALQARGYIVSYSPARRAEVGEPGRVASQSPRAGQDGGSGEARRRGVVEVRLSDAPSDSAFTPEGTCLRYDEVTLGR